MKALIVLDPDQPLGLLVKTTLTDTSIFFYTYFPSFYIITEK